MYCTNYDYHGIYETGYNYNYVKPCIIHECSICLESQKSTEYSNIVEYPIQLQTALYIKPCNCNIWIHVSCLDHWYNLNHNCVICKTKMYKCDPFINILQYIIMCSTGVLFGFIQIIIHILTLLQLVLFLFFWYNVIFIIRFIFCLPFSSSIYTENY